MDDIELEIQQKRDILINTAPDHYSGDELDDYVERVQLMTDEEVEKEYFECWDTDEVLEQYL